MTFELPELPYTFDALEPYIDAKTMEIHYSKHHAAYTTNLNAALEWLMPEHQTIEYVLTHLDEIPEDKRKKVNDNGGGYLNHSLFWKMMTPNGGGHPSGTISTAIDEMFGSFDSFKEKFTQNAMETFGSGRTRLCKDKDDKLVILKTPFQNNPITQGNTPVLGIDLREHAYYLKHQNRKAEYIIDRWNIINREQIEDRYAAK